MLKDKILQSSIALKQLHECYNSFLGKDGRTKHHSFGKDEEKNHHPPPILKSLVGLKKWSSFLGGNPSKNKDSCSLSILVVFV